MNSEYYDEKICAELKRIADALERIAEQRQAPAYFETPWYPYRTYIPTKITVRSGPIIADPPYTTTSGSWTQIDDDNLTPVGEPS